MTALYLGGYDARAAFGFVVERIAGLHDAPPTSLTLQAVPGRAGALRMASPQVEVRQLTISGTIRGATAAAARTQRDTLLAVLQREQLTLRTGDDLSRQLRIDVTGVTSTTPGPQFIAPDLRLELTATAAEPYWSDITETTVGSIGTTPVACAVGSAPVAPRLTITGAGSVVHVLLRTAGGDLVTRLQLVGLVPSTPIVIDCAAQTVTQGGVSQLRALLAGEFPVLDVATQGDPVTGAWPTLAVSQGTMTAVYAKRWR